MIYTFCQTKSVHLLKVYFWVYKTDKFFPTVQSDTFFCNVVCITLKEFSDLLAADIQDHNFPIGEHENEGYKIYS